MKDQEAEKTHAKVVEISKKNEEADKKVAEAKLAAKNEDEKAQKKVADAAKAKEIAHK